MGVLLLFEPSVSGLCDDGQMCQSCRDTIPEEKRPQAHLSPLSKRDTTQSTHPTKTTKDPQEQKGVCREEPSGTR
jgi:hypothetical protein